MILTALALMLTAPAQATDTALDTVVGAVLDATATCRAWLTRPAGTDAATFPAQSGLSGKLIARDIIPEAAMPPADWRVANHFWYIAAGQQGGLFVTVSDTLPVCNVIGGSAQDLEPGIERALAAPAFVQHWAASPDTHAGDMRSTRYTLKTSSGLWMLVSRADRADARRDRAQIAITAKLDGTTH